VGEQVMVDIAEDLRCKLHGVNAAIATREDLARRGVNGDGSILSHLLLQRRRYERLFRDELEFEACAGLEVGRAAKARPNAGPADEPLPLRVSSRGFTAIPYGDLSVLASQSCGQCRGRGVDVAKVCLCVQRRRFRDCLRHFRDIAGSSFIVDAEFRADFCLAARRSLDPLHCAVFDAYFVRDLDWRGCRAAVGIHRGRLFHAVYRIEAIAGLALYVRGMCPTRLYYAGNRSCRWGRPTAMAAAA